MFSATIPLDLKVVFPVQVVKTYSRYKFVLITLT